MGGASSSWPCAPDRGKGTYWQVPLTHPWPAAHSVPHMPQLFASVRRFEHVPAQFVVPVGQPHSPLLQTRLLPHTTEQCPQSLLLLSRSTHIAVGPVPHSTNPEAAHEAPHTPSLQMGVLPPHRLPQLPQSARLELRFSQSPRPARPPAHCVSPAGHAHVPFVHAPPPGHAVPQAPQLRLLFWRFTQAFPHCVSPPAVLHVPVQTPAVQSVPAWQRFRHAPQLFGSFCVSVQVVPQSDSAPQVQAAFTHDAPAGHDLLHPPQFAGSSSMSTQALVQSVSAPASESQDVAHVPSTQKAPPPSIALQALPQAPQLFGSLCVAVQTPLQRMPPFAHWQVPAWHAVPLPHRTPQAPQLELSVCSSTQAPSHCSSPLGQRHWPPWHVVPLPQTLPQAPQSLPLLDRSTHAPEQYASMAPASAGQVHLPAEHVAPSVQMLPHAPQLFGSDCSLTQAFAQFVSGEVHTSVHVPFEQTSPAAQALLQAPQSSGFDARSTQVPLQRAGFTPWVQAQVPAEQVCPPVHALAHAPQLLGSVCSLTQAFEQSVSPVPHVSVHMPPVHTSPAPHVRPHLPQFVGLDERSTHAPSQSAGVVPVVHAHVPSEQT